MAFESDKNATVFLRLMPGIHVLMSECKDVDGRDKPGHDEVFDLQFLRLPRQ